MRLPVRYRPSGLVARCRSGVGLLVGALSTCYHGGWVVGRAPSLMNVGGGPYSQCMKSLVGLGLLASAFAPLVALLAIVQIDELGRVGWAILAACVLAELLLFLVLRTVSQIQARTIETTSVRRADERVLAFTSSYVVPVVVVMLGEGTATTIVATTALVGLLAIIYVRAGLYHLNPTLALLGYRLYEVTETNGTVTMLLTTEKHLAVMSRDVVLDTG